MLQLLSLPGSTPTPTAAGATPPVAGLDTLFAALLNAGTTGDPLRSVPPGAQPGIGGTTPGIETLMAKLLSGAGWPPATQPTVDGPTATDGLAVAASLLATPALLPTTGAGVSPTSQAADGGTDVSTAGPVLARATAEPLLAAPLPAAGLAATAATGAAATVPGAPPAAGAATTVPAPLAPNGAPVATPVSGPNTVAGQDEVPPASTEQAAAALAGTPATPVTGPAAEIALAASGTAKPAGEPTRKPLAPATLNAAGSETTPPVPAAATTGAAAPTSNLETGDGEAQRGLTGDAPLGSSGRPVVETLPTPSGSPPPPPPPPTATPAPSAPAAPPPMPAAPTAAAAADPVLQQPPQMPTATLDEVAIHVARAVGGRQPAINLQLQPASLGRLEITLHFDDDDGVRVHVRADRVETLEQLARHGHQLERALQQSGLDVGRDGIRFDLNAQTQDGTPQQRRWAAFERLGQAAPGEADPPPVEPQPHADSHRLLDLDA